MKNKSISSSCDLIAGSSIFLFLMLLIPQLGFTQTWKANVIAAMGNGGAYVEDENGKVLFAHRADEKFIPASTIKLVTGAVALKELGFDYRIPTDFYLQGKTLYIKGYGDPLLVSQELHQIAKILRSKDLPVIEKIILDNGFFAPNISVDGISTSPNPYDAVNAALLANFNTISIRRNKQGAILPGEPQTPLTPMAIARAKNIKARHARVNLGGGAARASLYFGELLTEFLRKEGLVCNPTMELGSVPDDMPIFYHHESSQILAKVVADMLEHSTNLTANQLFLITGAIKYGPPASLDKGVKAMSEFLATEVGMSDFNVTEGSGLSRKNLFTPRMLTKIVKYWEPRHELLPMKREPFLAKTGTLNGVTTLAGFFPLPDGKMARFSLLVNDKFGYAYKFKLARMIYNGLHGITEAQAKH